MGKTLFNSSKIRTDLALERNEDLNKDKTKLEGIQIDEEYNEECDVKLTKLIIINEEGAKKLGRDIGKYYTFETMNLDGNDGEFHSDLSEYISHYLKEIIIDLVDYDEKKGTPVNILVAGLGNRDATPDSLGPLVVNNLYISPNNSVDKKKFAKVTSIAPGVLAQTGIETAKILRGIINENSTDVMIVVDALAARCTSRLANTIQICDTGIMPGSGVANHRTAIKRENIGIPVVAIGVPTVVDAATIVRDAVEKLFETLEEPGAVRKIKNVINSFEPAMKIQFMRELISDNMSGMYVTPKDIDEMVKRVSFTISEAINKAFW